MNVKSAERVIKIVELIADEPRSHAQLAAALAIPKSSLTGLLHTLTEGNFLAFDPISRTYRLGSAMVLIAQKYLAGMDLATISREAVDAVTRETGEATAMVISAGEDILIIAKAMGSHPIRRTMQVGERAPMTLSAAGRVFLAYMPESARFEIVTRQLAECGKGPENASRILEMIADVARGGMAYTFEELIPGIVAMALPVIGREGRLVGSLSVSAPASRYDDALVERIETSLRHHADRLGRTLGADGPLSRTLGS
ncbi:IclR family transcriptional regulator [Oricola thermophila]|uniref:IclR family transcriptional regulator n=1 Tax=Oricola thermophila TaxID=2742145 RepID=A0A6N1VFZ8_9HYPH|nr:IclR family transcriptional regulator [Oricola thermophila]